MAGEIQSEVVSRKWRDVLIDDLKAMSWTRYGLILVILLMVIIFATMNPNFYSGTNLRNVARQTAILGIVACGQTLVILSGGFDLSVGMVLGFVSVTSSISNGPRLSVPPSSTIVMRASTSASSSLFFTSAAVNGVAKIGQRN